MQKMKYIYLLIFLLLLFNRYSICSADSMYFQFLSYPIKDSKYFLNENDLYDLWYYFYNSLLKEPVPVWMLPWFIGYEKRFSSKSLFNHHLIIFLSLK